MLDPMTPQGQTQTGDERQTLEHLLAALPEAFHDFFIVETASSTA